MPRPAAEDDVIMYDTMSTTTAGQHYVAPPSCRARFIARDNGNASVRYIRPTTHVFPAGSDMVSNSALPLAVFVQPLAVPDANENDIPLVDFGPDGPVRCIRCGGYVNPFAKWSPNCAQWQCVLC